MPPARHFALAALLFAVPIVGAGQELRPGESGSVRRDGVQRVGARREGTQSKGAGREEVQGEKAGRDGAGRDGVQGEEVGRGLPEVGIPAEAVNFAVEPLDGDVEWLRDEVDPIQQARRRIRMLMHQRAEQHARELDKGADRSASPQDPAVEWGDWRFSIGNNGNWSPFPDRALDARIIRFPLRMKSDNRPGAEKALEQMRKTGGGWKGKKLKGEGEEFE